MVLHFFCKEEISRFDPEQVLFVGGRIVMRLIVSQVQAGASPVRQPLYK
jgi:hypothetical protein